MTGSSEMEEEALRAALDWGVEALDLARRVAAEGFEAAEKGAAFDMVTPGDGQIEELLRARVAARFPDHSFLGEESGGAAGLRGLQWVVDPIDGTLNYATGLAGATTSIALVRDGDPVVGVIADFATGIVYGARSGTGTLVCRDAGADSIARPNPTPIGSARVFLEWGWEDLDPVMLGTLEALRGGRQRVIRMVGGAAYALLHVALHGGTMLGISLRLWDVAAGVVIAREAGLSVRTSSQGASTHVIAGSALDVQEFAGVVDEFGSRRFTASA